MKPSNHPSFRSHWIPRTRDGWIAVITFAVLFALAEPPLLYWIANRIEPIVLGVPFLYTYLLAIYLALTAVLIWVHKKRV